MTPFLTRCHHSLLTCCVACLLLLLPSLVSQAMAQGGQSLLFDATLDEIWHDSIPIGGRHFALLVGIAERIDGETSLPAAQRDLQNMRDALSLDPRRWPDQRVRVLKNGEATKAGIRAALATLAEEVSPGDTVLYYHSSHGYPLWHMDGGIDLPSAALDTFDFPYDGIEFVNDLSAFPRTVNVVVLLDACHSGGMATTRCDRCLASWEERPNGTARWRPAPDTPSLQDAVVGERGKPHPRPSRHLPSNIAWITGASQSRQASSFHSVEDPVGFSLFTVLLTQGFKRGDVDGDGKITFWELFTFSKTEIRSVWSWTAIKAEPRYFNATLLMKVVARSR